MNHFSASPPLGEAKSAWRELRRLRSDPPVVNRERAVLFCAALEQSEQQYAAAMMLPPDSRAINLFYGISQAGRAISAVLTPSNDRCLLRGHGIEVKTSTCTGPGDFASLRIKSKGKGDSSFLHLSSLLDSDPLIQGTTLGALWDQIPEEAIPDLDGSHPPIINLRDRTSTLPAALRIPRSVNDIEQHVLPVGTQGLPRDAESIKEAYPDLSETPTVGEAPVDPEGRYFSVQFRGGKFRSYAGRPILIPGVGGPTSIHPLMTWWAVLFVLSMLTRYEPELWTQLIDVNSSTVAVSLETLMDTALSTVPALVLDVVTNVDHASYCEVKDVSFAF